MDRSNQRWNGWGLIDGPDLLGDKADAVWAWMEQTLAVAPLPQTPAVPLENITLPESRLSAAQRERLSALLAPDRVRCDAFERAFHARGRSYHDLLYLRSGRLDTAPDAVVYPESAEETHAVLAFAEAEDIAVVAFGGGSSVVGGVTGNAGAHRAVITLDTTRMNRILDIDEKAQLARIEAGIYGPALETALQAQGWTLSHYPQSFEFSTLGGWIAARGAGHQSIRYGKAEHWLRAATLATAKGVWSTENFPASAAGPLARDWVAGSEGVLGVITDATVHIRPVPAVKDYRAYIFLDFTVAVEAMRDLMQQDAPVAMIRLSDPDETYFYQALHTGGEGADPSVRFCLMLVGIEGDEELVAAARVRSQAILEKHGAMPLGEHLGETWYTGRFVTPYLRDPMLDRGLAVDTLETATRWSNLLPLYEAVIAALRDALAANPAAPGARGIVMAHVSHAYADGASLYFTFAFPRALDCEVAQWWAIKRAASDAIVRHGGTISHHHGVGEDHREWMAAEKGPLGLGALRALKAEFDPAGILNPGKLLP
jgi:alkyldihydroxyacetonephosphate synthase